MSADWYIERDGKKTGPHSTSQLKQLARNGAIKDETIVIRGDKRAKAESVKGLFPAVAIDGECRLETEPPLPPGWIEGSSVVASPPVASEVPAEPTSKNILQIPPLLQWAAIAHIIFCVAVVVALIVMEVRIQMVKTELRREYLKMRIDSPYHSLR